VNSESQALVFIGYKRPNATHADDLVFDVLSLILAGGRTGMLERDLVRERKLALAAPNVPTFPAGKYTNLFATLIAPAGGVTVEENEKAFEEILEKLKSAPVDEATLDRVRAKARGGLLRRLENNSGLAALLSVFHAQYGTWQRLFTALNDLEKIKPEDVMRVAREHLIDRNKTVVSLGPASQGGSK